MCCQYDEARFCQWRTGKMDLAVLMWVIWYGQSLLSGMVHCWNTYTRQDILRLHMLASEYRSGAATVFE